MGGSGRNSAGEGATRRTRTRALALVATLSIGAVAATSAPAAAPQSEGSTRSWGGTTIESLDTPRASAAASDPVSGPVGSVTLGPAESSAPPAQGAPRDERLSDERTRTLWANANERQVIYRDPDAASPRVARLRYETEDDFPEIYLILNRHWDAQNQEWIQVRVPMRPNGTVGWVRRRALGTFRENHMLVVISRRRLRAFVYNNGRRIWSAPVGVGKRRTPTPAGRFWIRERFKIKDRRSPYAPYALGTGGYSRLSDWPGGGVIGIHGDWNRPRLIPGRPSHGCIRMHKPDVSWLAHHVGLGTPVRVV